MKVKNAILMLEKNDIKECLNSFINAEGIMVNDVNFTKNNIEIKGNIKKIFTLDFSCNIEIIEIINDILVIKIKNVKALKINLFSVIERVVRNRNSHISVGKYIKIEKDLISVNLEIIKLKFHDLDFKVDDIKIEKNAVEVNFKYIDINLLSVLKKRNNGKKEKVVN